MIFHYNSSRFDVKRALSPEITRQLRSYLSAVGGIDKMTHGELQDALLDFRYTEGRSSRLLINQLEPVFIYLARNGRLWPEETSG